MFRKRLTILIITLLTISFPANLIKINDFKGIDQKTSPEKIMQGRAVDITNLDFDVAGSIQTRKGIVYQQSFNDNIKNINDRAVNNYIFDSSIEYKGVVGSYNVSQYTNIGDDIYFFGQDNVKWHNANTSFKSLGYDSPTSMNATSTAITGNLNGTYNYAITYVYGDEESNPYYANNTSTGSIVMNNSIFQIDLGSNKKFYMHKVGGKIMAYYVVSDIVEVKREMQFTGDKSSEIWEGNYLYYITYDGTIYRIYKINISECRIENTGQFTPNPYHPIFAVNSNSVVYCATEYIELAGNNHGSNYYRHGVYIYEFDSNLSKYTKKQDWNETEQTFHPIGGSLFVFYVNNSGDKIIFYRFGYGKYWLNITSGGAVSGALKYSSQKIIPIAGEKAHVAYARGKIYITNYVNPSYKELDISSTITGYNVSIFDISSTNIQLMQNNKWYNFQYNLSTLTINLVASANWIFSETNTKVVAINQKVLISLPEVPTLSTGINIYRQWNSTGYYFLDNIVYGNTTYLDNIANTDQSVVPMETDNGSPPNAIDSEYIVARQFYLAPDGVVWYSKINKFESVPDFNYIRIKTDRDDSPVRIIEHFGGLLVFFQKSIWYIDLSSAEPIMWIPRKLNTDFGCPYPNSVVKGKLPNQQVGVFYMAEDKSIRVLTGVGSDSIQLFDNIYTDKLSIGVEGSLKNDDTNVNDVYLTFYDYKLYVSLRNNLLIWDSQVGGEWTKYELPIQQRYIGVVDNELVFGSGENMYSTIQANGLNILKNGDFREGLISWNLGSDDMTKNNIKGGAFYYDGSFITRSFTIPDGNEYYIYINYEAIGDDLYFLLNGKETILEGSGVHSAQVSEEISIRLGEKPKIREEDYLTRNILFGWNYMGIISGDSMLVSEIIGWLEETLGAGSINDVQYYVDGVETLYSASGDATLNNGEGYFINSGTRGAFIFEWTMPERVTIDFKTGANYIFGYPYKEYKASEFLDKLEYASDVWVYDNWFYNGWLKYSKNGTGTDFNIGNVIKTYGLRVDAIQDFTMVFEPASGIISSIYVIGTQNIDLYVDNIEKDGTLEENGSFSNGFSGWNVDTGSSGTITTVDSGICLEHPWSPTQFGRSTIYQTITVSDNLEKAIFVAYNFEEGELNINGVSITVNGIGYITTYTTSDTILLSVTIRGKYYSALDVRDGKATIYSMSVKYVDGLMPISWNYKTKIYADNYEFSSEFDKIWLRGYQESDAERVRVDLKNNKNNTTKTNTLYMSVSGNAEVNTAVNSLVGSNGRDVQAELSGSKYIRLDGISIKYSPREE